MCSRVSGDWGWMVFGEGGRSSFGWSAGCFDCTGIHIQTISQTYSWYPFVYLFEGNKMIDVWFIWSWNQFTCFLNLILSITDWMYFFIFSSFHALSAYKRRLISPRFLNIPENKYHKVKHWLTQTKITHISLKTGNVGNALEPKAPEQHTSSMCFVPCAHAAFEACVGPTYDKHVQPIGASIAIFHKQVCGGSHDLD